jgi:hypothetical protein
MTYHLCLSAASPATISAQDLSFWFRKLKTKQLLAFCWGSRLAPGCPSGRRRDHLGAGWPVGHIALSDGSSLCWSAFLVGFLGGGFELLICIWLGFHLFCRFLCPVPFLLP